MIDEEEYGFYVVSTNEVHDFKYLTLTSNKEVIVLYHEEIYMLKYSALDYLGTEVDLVKLLTLIVGQLKQ